jgi:hypothetical protein
LRKPASCPKARVIMQAPRQSRMLVNFILVVVLVLLMECLYL